MSDTVVELLQKLVAIPSVNPEDTDDPAITGEQRLADYLKTRLEQDGWQVEYTWPEPGRPNLVARFGSEAAARSLMFEAHLDTVSVANMTIDPFAAELRDGRLYGRGACDMKGPMAAALHALSRPRLERLSAAGIQLIFVAAMGEEKGNQGALELAKSDLKADELIVLEPTGLQLVTAHKGTAWMEVELTGRAGHGSEPSEGVNAIEAAGRLMEALRTRTADRAKTACHPQLGGPTLNTGKISGGSAVNIIADRCVLELDRRLLPGESAEDLLGEVQQEIDRLKAGRELVDGKARLIKATDPMEADPASALVQDLMGAAALSGVESLPEGAPWFSDAGPLKACCRDLVVFGPGSIAQAHRADEYIELESLQLGADILAAFLDQRAKAGRA